MAGKFTGLTAFVLLASGAANAGMDTATEADVCSAYAATILLGHNLRTGPFHTVSQVELEKTIQARDLKCEPMDRYFEIAKYRLQRQQEQADRSNEFFNNLQRQNAERFRQQSEDQQRLWQQQRDRNRQTHTTCQTIGTQVNCTTTDG